MNREYLDEAEKLITGGILYFGCKDDYCIYALDNLEPSDFLNPIYQSIFAYLKQNRPANGNTDNVALMKQTGISREILAELLTCCCTVSNFKSYVAMLRERTTDTRISSSLDKIRLCENKFTELEKIYLEEKKINDRTKIDTQREKEIMIGNFIDYIFSPIKENERIFTGFKKLDATLKGLRNGCISVIGAYPSTGKTSMAINIAVNQLKNKNKTMFFSLEMSKYQIYERLISCALMVDADRIEDRSLTDEEKSKIMRFFGSIIHLDNFTVHDDFMYIEDITREIANSKPDFVIIDFIQRIRTYKKTCSRRDEIDYISSEIKRTASHINCHIMSLSQLARRGEGHIPTMDDLKESGGLTQDNDYIFMLYRPNVSDKTKPFSETYFTLDKNKFGATGTVKMNFDGKRQKFSEII